MSCPCGNGYVEAEQVDPNSIPGNVRGARGMGQAASGGFTYYTPSGTTVSVNLPGPAGPGIQETIREWLGMDSLVAGVPNGWIVLASVGLWFFGRRR
jgi:hypothetical protein